MVSLYDTSWILFSILIGIKVLLIPCYTSTDFEVHRNWMAITFHKPLSQWYYESTSEWTLDYPPFFAYFEKALATLAFRLGYINILDISKEPIFNSTVLLFQRISVIGCDIIYMLVCYLFCQTYSGITTLLPIKVGERTKCALLVLLAANAGLIMVDNIHFQYNSMLTALLLLSTLLVSNEHYLLGAFAYCSLLNFKHIYLYFAPAYAVYYLKHYFDLSNFSIGKLCNIVMRIVALASVMVIPFIASLGPFIWTTGFDGLIQMVSRLFPVSRGLTHAYWAPNFWALYNFVDLVLFRVLKLFKVDGLKPASYSSGLVQEHSHSVLPTIYPLTSLLFIMVGLSPLLLTFFQKKRNSFSLYLTISAFSFFYFGYHVHEKALLMISIPLIIVAITQPKFLSASLLFSTITSFSLFPLLFTTFEVYIKYGIASVYFSVSLLAYKYGFGTRLKSLLPQWLVIYCVGLFGIELYNSFVHRMIFGNSLEFFPLMAISVYNSIGITICYGWILKLALEDEYLLFYKKKKCEVRETLIRDGAFPVQSIESLDEVQMIGGVDISTSKINPEMGVAALTVYSYPDLQLLATHDEIVFISEPYINDYLALREAEPLASMITSFLEDHPNLRPDVLLCDGNGEFHSRGCGVASHIGALSGIPTIGVAKKFNLSLLKSLHASEKTIVAAEKFVETVCKENGNGWTPFNFVEPVVMNIVRVGGSKNPLFVSAGYGIDLSLATEIAASTAKSRICEPIRAADLLSRQKVRDIFGE